METEEGSLSKKEIFQDYAQIKNNAAILLEFQLYECQMYQVTLKEKECL